jgi:spore coat protein U-like protein
MQLKFITLFFLIVSNGVVHASCIGLNCSCTTTANAVAFGTYNPLSGTALTATGNVAVTCSALVAGLNVSYVISLDAGQNGSFSARKMAQGGSLLQYNLYTSAAYTTVWGDGTSGTSTVSDAYLLSLLSVTRNYTVYGSMPVSQNVTPGTGYADTITVTVTY